LAPDEADGVGAIGERGGDFDRPIGLKVTLVTPDVEPFATQEGFEVFGVVDVVRAIADEDAASQSEHYSLFFGGGPEGPLECLSSLSGSRDEVMGSLKNLAVYLVLQAARRRANGANEPGPTLRT